MEEAKRCLRLRGNELTDCGECLYNHIDSTEENLKQTNQERYFSNVPFLAVSNFVERPLLYTQLKSQLHDVLGFPSDQCRIAVIHGFGGTGKTQLVLNYIKRHTTDYDGIFWISLVSMQSVEQAIFAIYRHLFNVSDGSTPQFSETLALVQNWFHGKSERFLWVFDNADNVENAKHSEFIDLQSLIPQDSCIQVIITTRSTKVSGIATSTPVEVESLDPQQSLELFWTSSKIDPEVTSENNVEAAQKIIEDLGHHALGISIAGAAIAHSPRMSKDLQEYLDLYTQNKSKLLNQKPDTLISRYNKSIFVSWETSVEIMSLQSPLAVSLLGFISIMNSDQITFELIEQGFRSNPGGTDSSDLDRVNDSDSEMENNNDSDIENDSDSDIDDNNGSDWRIMLGYHEEGLQIDQFEEALAVLESFSLLKYSQATESYIMHRLIQTWGYERISCESQITSAQAVCGFFENIIKSNLDQRPQIKSQLILHIMQSFRSISRTVLGQDLVVLKWFLKRWHSFHKFTDEAGYWEGALSLSIFIQDMTTAVFGTEHQQTLISMIRVSLNNDKLGNWEQGEIIMRKVIKKREQLYGAEAPMTFLCMRSLARILVKRGKTSQAATISKESLQKCQRFYGGNHCETLKSKCRYARVIEHDKPEEAITMLEEVIAKSTRQDEACTIEAMITLAFTFNSLKRYEESAKIFRKVLKIIEPLFGPYHPYVFETKWILASVMEELDQVEASAALRQEAHHAREIVHGADNPETLLSKVCLAYMEAKKDGSREAIATMIKTTQRLKTLTGDSSTYVKHGLFYLSTLGVCEHCVTSSPRSGSCT